MNDVEQTLQEIEAMAQKVKKSVEVSKENLKDLQTLLDRTDTTFFKSALVRIIKKNRQKFFDLLKEEMLSAAARTGEYAYAPYLSRLENSLDLAEISLKVTGRNLLIKIDLSPLGDIRDWGNAVKEVRRNPGNLRSRSRKINGENAAYFYWRTRIYKTDRYDTTIADQLSRVDNAPFWYLIEHGNANPPGFQVVAPAYPKVKARRVVEKTERRIKIFLDEEIRKELPRIEAEWISFIANKLGLKLTTKLKFLLKEYNYNLATLIDNLKDVKKLAINDIVARISTEQKQYDIIVTSKSLGLRGRLR